MKQPKIAIPRPRANRILPARFPLLSTIADVCSALSAAGILLEMSMPGDADIDKHLTGAAMSNRDCTGGEVLICDGINFKPKYAIDGALRGASLIVCAESVASIVKASTKVTVATVSDTHKALSIIPDAVYGYPRRNIRVFGITGTKGKTTATYMLKSILDSSDGCNGIDFTIFDGNGGRNRTVRDGASRTALIGSVSTYDGTTYSESVNTTPEYPIIADVMHDAHLNGFDNLVMEVSSQALKVGRCGSSAPFDIAGWLNIGKDHISPLEHPDFDDYFSSKLKIFDGAKVAVINARTDHFDRVIDAASKAGCRIVTFASEDENGNIPDGVDVIASNIDESSGLPEFDIVSPSLIAERRGTTIDADGAANQMPLHVKLGMPGRFNVDDALLAACFALLLIPSNCDSHDANPMSDRNIRMSDIADGLARATVPGRMETYPCCDGSIIGVVDYAHNKMSYEALLGGLRTNHSDDYLIAVFGAPGRKALDRRKDLPEVAAKYLDSAFITMEDPWDENPADIAREMEKNLIEIREYVGKPDIHTIIDRKEAIDAAYRLAYEIASDGKRVWVMLLGKGDEQEQHIGTGSGPDAFVEYPSDRELAILHAQRIDSSM